MAANIISLVVPKDVLKKCPGFCMDYGNSVIKVVYRPKEGVSEDKLFLKSFEGCDLSDAISFIKDHADINKGCPVVPVTGFGCYRYQKELNEKLNVRVESVSELDCHISGFMFALNNIPRRDLVYEINDDIVDATIAEQNLRNATLDEAGKHTGDRMKVLLDKKWLSNSAIPLGKAEDVYPCLLCILGSGLVFYKVEKGGRYSIVDIVFHGGRCVYGLATLLTECKTYEEFLELAGKGSDFGVNTYLHDLQKVSNQEIVKVEEPRNEQQMTGGGKDQQPKHNEKNEDFYGAALNEADGLLFFFGKAVNSQQGQFNKEDIARALLMFFANEFTEVTEHAAKNLSEFSFDFIVPGPYLGAIGALLKGKEKDNSL